MRIESRARFASVSVAVVGCWIEFPFPPVSMSMLPEARSQPPFTLPESLRKPVEACSGGLM